MILKKPFTVWLTGLSGAGKTTLAAGVQQLLGQEGIRAAVLDGDIVRKKLFPDLGFTKKDRELNVKRIAHMARLINDNGIPAIVSAISPYRSGRASARAVTREMLEIFVECPPEICEKRDVKGLYRKARAGRIDNFTWVSDPYEEPDRPDLIVRTHKEAADRCAERILELLTTRGYIK